MQTWYAPQQIILALGVTLPIFLLFGWRLYGLLLDHRQALRRWSATEAMRQAIAQAGYSVARNEVERQLALARLFAGFDLDIASRRRALRADAQNLVLVGFVGTLIGVMGAFAGLVGPTAGADIPGLLRALIDGGLATALVSSLVATLLSVLVHSALSRSEYRLAALRRDLLSLCQQLSPSLEKQP